MLVLTTKYISSTENLPLLQSPCNQRLLYHRRTPGTLSDDRFSVLEIYLVVKTSISNLNNMSTFQITRLWVGVLWDFGPLSWAKYGISELSAVPGVLPPLTSRWWLRKSYDRTTPDKTPFNSSYNGITTNQNPPKIQHDTLKGPCSIQDSREKGEGQWEISIGGYVLWEKSTTKL